MCLPILHYTIHIGQKDSSKSVSGPVMDLPLHEPLGIY